MYADPTMPNTSFTPLRNQRLDERLGRRHLLLAGDGRRQLGGLVHCMLLALGCTSGTPVFHSGGAACKRVPDIAKRSARTSTFGGRAIADDARRATRSHAWRLRPSDSTTQGRIHESALASHARAVALATAFLLCGTAFAQTAAAPVRMRIQTAVPSASIYFELLKRMGDRIDRMSARRA